MTVSYRQLGDVREIGQTVDYSNLIRIAGEVMKETEELLETVAQKMAARVKEACPRIVEINITIEKIAAAIPNFGGRVGVTLQNKYE
jgi:dihydroneopterin aldolase